MKKMVREMKMKMKMKRTGERGVHCEQGGLIPSFFFLKIYLKSYRKPFLRQQAAFSEPNHHRDAHIHNS